MSAAEGHSKGCQSSKETEMGVRECAPQKLKQSIIDCLMGAGHRKTRGYRPRVQGFKSAHPWRWVDVQSAEGVREGVPTRSSSRFDHQALRSVRMAPTPVARQRPLGDEPQAGRSGNGFGGGLGGGLPDCLMLLATQPAGCEPPLATNRGPGFFRGGCFGNPRVSMSATIASQSVSVTLGCSGKSEKDCDGVASVS